MIRIAHRGNINGPSDKENQVSHIANAIDLGFDAEVDLWVIGTTLFLGHDEPKYEVQKDFLVDNGSHLWIHCKNIEALYFLRTSMPQLNYFWHEKDSYTLTSHGYIWTYPEKSTTDKSVIVSLDGKISNNNVYGICSDIFKKEF